MTTVGEEIEAWIEEYKNGDAKHKWVMNQEAALCHFKAEQIWNFVKTMPEIPNPWIKE